MTVKTRIDIEDLVRWTYQVQRADLIVGSGVGLYEGEGVRRRRRAHGTQRRGQLHTGQAGRGSRMQG